MSTNFPASKDNLTNPTATSSTSTVSHAAQHANANDAIEALQTKVGVNNSTDVNSLDYKIRNLTLPVAGTDFIAFSEKGAPGGVAKLNSNGVISVDNFPGEIYPNHVGAGTVEAGQLIVYGAFTLNGSAQEINATNLTLTDPLIYMGKDNPADSVDLGFVSSFTKSGPYPYNYNHSGLVRDASDGKWKLFEGVTDEPGLTVNFDQAVYATLKAGAFEGDGSQLTNLPIPTISSASPQTEGVVYGKTISGKTLFGYGAGKNLTSGSNNIVLGSNAMGLAPASNENVVIGNNALSSSTSGSSSWSVIIGSDAVKNASNGAISSSVVIGWQAGSTMSSSSQNVVIGALAEPSSSTAHHEITLGSQYIERFRIPGLGIDWTASTIPSQQVKFNNKTSSYTLQASDNHKMIRVNSSSNATITIPVGVFALGDEITIQNTSSSNLDIVMGGPGVIESSASNPNNPVLRSQYSAATIICVDSASNVFTVIGDII